MARPFHCALSYNQDGIVLLWRARQPKIDQIGDFVVQPHSLTDSFNERIAASRFTSAKSSEPHVLKSKDKEALITQIVVPGAVVGKYRICPASIELVATVLDHVFWKACPSWCLFTLNRRHRLVKFGFSQSHILGSLGRRPCTGLRFCIAAQQSGQHKEVGIPSHISAIPDSPQDYTRKVPLRKLNPRVLHTYSETAYPSVCAFVAVLKTQ